MHDATTQQPLHVSTDGTAGPYIMLPYSRVPEVTRLLDAKHPGYWVEENIVSLNDGPYMAVINLGRNADAAAVQATLDGMD